MKKKRGREREREMKYSSVGAPRCSDGAPRCSDGARNSLFLESGQYCRNQGITRCGTSQPEQLTLVGKTQHFPTNS